MLYSIPCETKAKDRRVVACCSRYRPYCAPHLGHRPAEEPAARRDGRRHVALADSGGAHAAPAPPRPPRPGKPQPITHGQRYRVATHQIQTPPSPHCHRIVTTLIYIIIVAI